MKPAIKLIIDEPTPGSYAWTLLETDDKGANPLRIASAEDTVDTYELALASGQRALDSVIRRRASGTVSH